jgi:hypothetical protein
LSDLLDGETTNEGELRQQAQARAALSVNAELVRLYWDIGRMNQLGNRWLPKFRGHTTFF